MKAITTFFSVILITLVSITSVSAQQKASDFDGALLWKVSGNGLSKPSYILGTHHLTHVKFIDEIPGLRQAIESTEQTVGELLMADQTAMSTKIQQAAMMPAGESYSKLLTAEEYKDLDEGLTKMFTVGLGQFGQMKPGMISMLYSITMFSKLDPTFNPMSHEAIDAYVQRVATEKGKPTLGLETVEDQIYALFEAEPLQDQAKSLACAVKNEDYGMESLKKLNEYYANKQLFAMYNLAFNNPDEPCQMSQTYQGAINKDRNDKWLAKLPQIMKEKSNLIAVGALHLAGEEGLLYQLAKRGYTIEAVK